VEASEGINGRLGGRKKEARDRGRQHHQSGWARRKEPMSQPATVLVVDDELGPRESLRVILQHDYHVLVATDGEPALHLAAHEPVDVVLLDLRLAGRSGLQVLEKMKALHPALAVIVVSGSDPYGLVPTERRVLLFEYIAKPFQVAHLRETVKRAVARRAQ
jgi:DNA-binding NtrC family response regulator